ncbi:MAG TPA: N-acetyl-gamma-glutamyl-phosphate reductase [bacterium]|nr:N-acetyl-gamma-glutamyl-phosphate reductase [bacterium]
MSLNVAIVGATGYTGLELARILLNHPKVKIAALTSERSAGETFSKVFPAYQGKLDLPLEALNPKAIAEKAELIFLGLPHHEAMEAAQAFRDMKKVVIDLSADFRLREDSVYEKWYGPHVAKGILKEAVYGLPELYREKIKQADLIANPGCYPTTNILGLAPLLKAKAIHLDSIVCDSKSGTSGAGRAAKTDSLFCEVNESIKTYGIGKHRHTPEIEQELSALAGEPVAIIFTPHLIPMDRGILSTIYAKPREKMSPEKLHALFVDFYKEEPFVRVKPLGDFPATRDVRFTNDCHLGVHYDARTDKILVVSVIDNLTKGASGQAVQNMNLRFGFDEKLGLEAAAPLA